MDEDHHLWTTPGGRIFFKLAIPRGLRHHFGGKDKVVESTGTDSPTAARSFRDQRLGYWRARFEHLATGGGLDDPLPMKLVPFADAMRAIGVRAAAPEQHTPDDDLFLFELDRLLKRADGKLPPQVQSLGQELARAVAAARYGLSPEASPSSPPSPAPAQDGTIAAAGGEETFAQALDAYLSFLEHEQKKPASTIRDFRRRGRKFIDHAGDLPLSAITYDVAKAFEERVAKTTGNGNAANQARSLCHTVIEHARERRKFDGAKQNPFKFRARHHDVNSHAKFTPADLHALFGSPTFTEREIEPKRYGVRSALPWIAAIGLYTGARAEEIAQLRRDDLRQKNGLWFFDITPAAGRLKTKSSERKTPVHPALIKLGLLRYHKALPKNAERLFPNLPVSKSRDGKFWLAVGKAFGRWRKAVGVHRPPEKLDFHSFRHTFTKALEDIGVSKNDADRLTGHEVDGVSYGVYSAPEMRRLATVIKRVRFARR